MVNTCTMLHYMMILHQIDNDEDELDSLYVYNGQLENDE